MKPNLTINDLIIEAKNFCIQMSNIEHPLLYGITDGKAVGTYVEHQFQTYLAEHYNVVIGNSASGIDLPGKDIMTDIKVTSLSQPQSSCPFKSARQKIFGLGYNLLVFVYNKHNIDNTCRLIFTHCTFIHNSRTADYTITRRIREMLKDGANKEKILG